MVKLSRFLSALLACFLAAPIAAHAAIIAGRTKPAGWQNAGWDGGGTYPSIQPDPNIEGKIYLLSDVTGQWFSDDRGDNWQWMNTTGSTVPSMVQAAFAQSKSHPEIMYVLGTGLMRSINGGASWTRVNGVVGTRTTVYKSIAIHPTNPDIVYIGGDNGKIYRTTTGGAAGTWAEYATPYSPSKTISWLYMNQSGTRLIAGTGNTMKKYNLEDGTSEVITLEGTNATKNYDFAAYTLGGADYLCVTAGLKIACSTDDGATWSYTQAIPQSSSYFIKRIAAKVDASENVRYMLSYELTTSIYTGGLYRSTDAGQNWTHSSGTLHADQTNNPTRSWYGAYANPPASISYDPFDDDVVYRTDDWGIWRSDDNGVHWYEKVKDAQNTVCMGLAVSANGTLFASAMDNGVLKSTNGGQTWTALYPTSGSGNVDAGHSWRVITTGTAAEWNAGNGHVIATSSKWVDFVNRVLRSTNNGTSWSVITSGLPTLQMWGGIWGLGYARGLVAAADNENILYMSMDGYRDATQKGGIFRSADNGVTWSRVTSSLSDDSWGLAYKVFNGILIDPTGASGAKVAYGTFGGGTYTTANSGTNWTYRGYPMSNVYDGAVDSRGWLYLTGEDGAPCVYRSKDSGASWTRIWRHPNPTDLWGAHAIAFHPTNPEIMAVSIDPVSQIWLTENVSADSPSFTNISTDIPMQTAVYDLLFNPHDDYLYVASGGGSIFKILLSNLSGGGNVTVSGGIRLD